MSAEKSMWGLEELKAEISRGGYFFVAGAEALLRQLPKGDWIGGTTPYFMTEQGGVHALNMLYALKLPPYIAGADIVSYSEDSLSTVYKDAPPNGFTLTIIPAGSRTHLSFALNAPGYEEFAASPLAGWIAGVPFQEIGKAVPRIFDGRTGQALEDGAMVMHVSLPKGRTAVIGIVNIFEPSDGDVLTFDEAGFSAARVKVNGVERDFAQYIAEKNLNTKLPLVASYGGAIINVSFQAKDGGGAVKFFAPVFKGVEYRHAKPVEEYLRAFMEQKPPDMGDRLLFSCNCILNYIHSGLEGKHTTGFTGPITFGEIGYQLLNQTAVYIEIVTANLAERLRDETALRRLNREMERQRDEILVLKNGIEQSTLGVVMTDTAGAIEYVNPAYTAMYGYEPEEVLGKNPRILKSGETPLPLYTSLWTTLLAGRPWSGELHNRTKAGGLIWIRANISPVRDSAGRLTHFMAMHKDITLEKRLISEVVAAKQEADRANQAKSNFLASMSHEIRTPLNAIVGMSELLDEAGLNKDQVQHLSIMRKASDTLLSLINDILDISKIEAGKVDIERAPFDLEDLVSTVAELISVQAFEKGVEVSCKIEGDVPVYVEGDATRLRQVLMNLMGNAVKFVEKGWIYLGVAKHKLEGDSLELLFSVRDTGIGIAGDKLDVIFDKFTQADASTTRKYGGTGLGLPISKMLIELMGGRIWVDSKPDEGTTFCFTVKLFTRKDNQAVYLPKADIAELKGRRFLVVDDNLVNRIIIREIVQSWGATCDGAPDGKRGLEKILEAQSVKAPFDCVFVDFNMPEMDGYEFCRGVRDNTAISPKPALALATSDTMRFKRQDFRAIGVNTYITKPVKKRVLLDSALEMLASGKAAAEAPKKTGYKPEDLPPLSILLTDDSEDNRILISAFLKGSKVKLELAVDGFDALKKLAARTYDLVLMDIQMPGMDGYEVAARLRALEAEEKRARTRLVALTAMAMREDVDKALGAGCDDYLTKPIRRNTLYAYLMKFAAGRPQ